MSKSASKGLPICCRANLTARCVTAVSHATWTTLTDLQRSPHAKLRTISHFTLSVFPLVFARCSVNYQPSSWRMHQNTYMGQSVSAKFCYQTTLQTCSSSEYEISWLPCCRIRKWHGGWDNTLTAGIEDNSRYQKKHIFIKRRGRLLLTKKF